VQKLLDILSVRYSKKMNNFREYEAQLMLDVAKQVLQSKLDNDLAHDVWLKPRFHRVMRIQLFSP
jgi:hypothetical protein